MAVEVLELQKLLEEEVHLLSSILSVEHDKHVLLRKAKLNDLEQHNVKLEKLSAQLKDIDIKREKASMSICRELCMDINSGLQNIISQLIDEKKKQKLRDLYYKLKKISEEISIVTKENGKILNDALKMINQATKLYMGSDDLIVDDYGRQKDEKQILKPLLFNQKA